ncbi:MerR family transcriptional regulator [Planctomycetota bacterium]
MRPLKVSELAKSAGVSVRTLHYYEEIGLLKPARTSAGHRRYGIAAIERLQQILSLRQLGFSLSRIDALLGGEAVAPERTVADHLAQIRAQRAALARLEKQLEHLYRLLRSGRTNDTEAVDALLKTLEAMTMYEKHLTPEHLQQVDALHETAGDAATKWQSALDGLRVEMEAGTNLADPKVRTLVEQWHDAAAAFMPSGDEAAHKGVMQLLHDEPQARKDHGLDDALFSYLGRALAPAEHAEG